MNRPIGPLVDTVDTANALAWPERNQRWLTERLEFWRDRIEQQVADAGERVTLPPALPNDDPDSAALTLGTLFGLSVFERELLVLAAGVEIDSGLRDAVARAQGTTLERLPRLQFSLALAILPQPHWDALSAAGPLRYWSLLEFDTSAGFDRTLLRVDERILHYLTGVVTFDERLNGVARLDHAPRDEGLVNLVSRVAQRISGLPHAVIALLNANQDAPHRHAGRSFAHMVLQDLGLNMLVVDSSAFALSVGGDPRELVATARRIDREAVLIGAGLALILDSEMSSSAPTTVVRLLTELRSTTVVLGTFSSAQWAELPISRQPLRYHLPLPQTLSPNGLSPAVFHAAQRALEQFRVEPTLLQQALAATAGSDDIREVETLLWDTLRESARGGLDTLAQRIVSNADFSDLVLPPSVAAQLREIAAQLRHRRTVYDEWGFGAKHGRGLGIAALFTGESGTGKTLAAEAIAAEARLDLYRIDLASVVSKYIGETEKNLAKLFDAAERSGAVLLFDEADALFGKRSEVKDSHDRYANIEVAYLLQRIECYRGLAILTTNLKSALDRAFLRRIRFVVQFPFPDAASRVELWRRAFPPQAPLGALDWAALAKLQLAGGNIRGIAVNAAFRAAARGGTIEHADVMASARAEFSKIERVFNAADGTARQVAL